MGPTLLDTDVVHALASSVMALYFIGSSTCKVNSCIDNHVSMRATDLVKSTPIVLEKSCKFLPIFEHATISVGFKNHSSLLICECFGGQY